MSSYVRQDRSRTGRYAKVVLAAGYVGVIVAVVAMQLATPAGYELSIYDATPSVAWVGVAVALLAALVTSFRTSSKWLQLGAYVLAGFAAITVTGLPLLRGYYFYGGGDSLSHLGWAGQFAAETGSDPDLLHPGIHLASVVVARAASGSLEWAMEFAVVAYFVAYLVFVPLTVRTIVADELAVIVGVFSAAMLIPINNVSAHPVPHPFTQAVMLFPFVLYVGLNYLARHQDERLSISSVGALLALTSVSVVLVHPQHALNVLLAYGGFVALQLLAWAYPRDTRLVDHHSMYFQTSFMGLVFFAWTASKPRFQRAFAAVTEGLLYGAEVGDEVGQRSTSLVELGGSIEELFLKLFLVGLVYGAVAGAFLLASIAGQLDQSETFRESLLKYLAVALVPPSVFFVLFFAASATTQPFRYIAAAMVPVTVLGAAGMAYWLAKFRDRKDAAGTDSPETADSGASRIDYSGPSPATGETGETRATSTIWRSVQVAVVVAFGIMLALSLITVHPSPYIYKSSAQVTEERMDGYRTVFEVRDPSIAFTGIRGGPRRYVHVEYGPRSERTLEFPGRRAELPPAVFDSANYSTYYGERRYLTTDDSDYPREVELYRGFRYSRRGFEALETKPGIDRVYDGEGIDLYVVGNATAG